MRKEDKAIVIEQLGEKIKEYAHFYIVDVTGLNSEQTSALRRKCFEKEIKMIVVKNNLLVKALDAQEVDFSPLYGSMKGMTAVMFCNTANVHAKLIKEIADKNNTIPAVKAAYAEEGFYVGADQLDALCAIKSKNEVIADIVALLQSPIKNVVSALEGNAGNLIHNLLTSLEERQA